MARKKVQPQPRNTATPAVSISVPVDDSAIIAVVDVPVPVLETSASELVASSGSAVSPAELPLSMAAAIASAAASADASSEAQQVASLLVQATEAEAAASPQPESLASQDTPVATPQPALRIFQIYYEAWQRELLDPNFAALDNSKSSSELYEFDVFARLARSEYVKDVALWGALSWRFTEKTGLTGQDLVRAIQANPGHDVYFCNPVPENEALYHNLWLQGETSHPQFLALTQAVFKATGLPLDALTCIEDPALGSAANYFIGTPRFWQTYLPWVQAVLSTANKALPPRVRDLLHSAQADDRGLHGGATYVPFIVERLFPVFMKTQGKALKGYKIGLPAREAELNVHLKLLREMREMAYRTRSAWLAACWVNYRNLYLTQDRGKEWSKKYLRAITPAEIRFG